MHSGRHNNRWPGHRAPLRRTGRRRARAALGDGVKRTYESEHAPLIKMGKKLCATSDLPAGHTITEADIALKSPGDGIAPYFQDVFVGKTLTKAVADDQAFTFEDIGLTEAAANEALKA